MPEYPRTNGNPLFAGYLHAAPHPLPIERGHPLPRHRVDLASDRRLVETVLVWLPGAHVGDQRVGRGPLAPRATIVPDLVDRRPLFDPLGVEGADAATVPRTGILTTFFGITSSATHPAAAIGAKRS